MTQKTVSRASNAPTSTAPKGATGNGSSDPFERVRKNPAEPTYWDAVDEAARNLDTPEATEAVYNDVLATDDLSLEARRLVGQRAVEFLEEWYEDTEKPIKVLLHCIQKDAGNAWALEKLSLLLTLAERWDDLLGTYDGALSNVEEKAQRIHLLEEAARIAKDFAGQANRASDYLKQLLLLRPDDTALATSLERRLEQQERFADLVDIWRARLPVVDTAGSIELRLKIARTLLEPLAEAAQSLTVASELLDNGQAEAETCELMERLASLEATPLATKRAALQRLEDEYSGAKRTEDTIRILRRALDIADEVALQSALYEKLVHWLEIAGAPGEAQQAAGEWLAVDPSDSDALSKLEELAEETKKFDALAAALVKASDSAGTTQVRVRLLILAAGVYRDKADIPHSATELYARVLLDGETEAADKLLAARQLRELLTSPAQAGQRLDVLEKLSVLEPATPDQSEVLQEAAQLAEKLGDDDRALRLWRECLDRDEADKLALDSRITILTRCERWPQLLEAYRARTEHPADQVECRADWVAIATLYDERLSDPGRAIETWRHIEGEFGRNVQTVDALYDLCCRTERWRDGAQLLAGAAKEADSDERKTELLARLGDILRLHLDEPAEALAEYERGLALLPASPACREGVIALIENQGVREAAAEVLAGAYRACEEWQAILDMLETRLDASRSPDSSQTILTEAATIAEQEMNSPSDALEHIQRAFAIAPKSELEGELLRLAEATGDWASAVTGYQLALVNCEDATRTTQLLLEQGRLQEMKLGDWNEALASYRRVVELDHEHLEGTQSVIRSAGHVQRWHDAAWAFIENARALVELDADVVSSWEDIAQKMNAWTEALAELEASLRDTKEVTPVASHHIKYQLAVWQHTKRNAREIAEALLKEAVAEHKATQSLELLVQLQRVAPSKDLVTSLLQLAELVDDPLPQLDEAAHVALEVVEDHSLARPILQKSLDTAERSLRDDEDAAVRKVAAWSLDRLVDIALAADDHGEAFAQLTHGTQVPFQKSHVLDLKHRAAVIATTALEQHATAITLCEEVLDEEPERIETVDLLAQLYESQGRLDPLVALLERELELPRDLQRRLQTRLSLSRILGLAGAKAKQRVETLTANLEEQPGHEPTIEALTEVLMAAGKADDLYEILCGQAELVEAAPHRAAALYAQAGHLARDHQQDNESAHSAFAKSVSHHPTCPVLDALADIHTERSEHPEAVAWLKQRLELTSTDELEARRHTLVRLGKALEAAGEVPEAVTALDTGLERDPAGNDVRALLIRLQEERQAWPELAILLAEGVPFLEEAPPKVDYLSRAAHVRWHKLNDVSGAIPLLQQAVKLSPKDRDLRLAFGEASRLGGLLPQARQLLSDLLDEFGRRRTPERARVHFQLALIDRAEQKLDAALEHLDAASSIARSDALILRTLGDVAREKGELERAETAYRGLLLLLGRGPGSGEGQGAEGESAILYELYKIANEKEDQDRARDLLDSALEKSENPAEAALLEQTLREAGEWELLHQSLLRRQSKVTSTEEERALTRDRAEALAHLGKPAEALELRLNLLAADPSDSDALEAAAKLAEQSQAQERFRHAVIDLAESLSAEQPKLSCQLWLRLGQDAEMRGDLNAAANYFERAQITHHTPETTFKALKRIHEQTGDMHGLTLALERFIDHSDDVADDELVKSAMYRLSEIELCSAAGRDKGVARLSTALERDGDFERGVTILVTAVEVVAPTEGMLELLQELARKTDDRDALALALFHSAMGQAPTLELLEEAVELARAGSDREKHGLLLRRTVEVARELDELPRVVWALVELSEQKQEQQLWEDARTLLREAVDIADDSEALELQLKLATLLDAKMGAHAEAAKIYEELAETEPGDPRVWKPLVSIYRRTGRSAELEACLSRAEEHAGEDERRALRLERIRLMVDEDRLDDAEQALRETLEQNPEDLSAADVLIELLQKQDRPSELRALVADSLSSAIDAADDENIVRYATKLGDLHEAADEPQEALAVYRQAQAAVRNNRELINAVLRLLPDDDQDERANLLESLIPAEPKDRVGTLAVQLAELRAQLGDEAGQERAMELGFKADPSNDTLRDRLEAWYRERDHFGPLVDLIVEDAQQRENPEQAIARYLEAANIHDQQLSDAFAAGDVLLKALALDPISLEVLEPLTKYLTTSGRATEAALSLTTALESAELDPQHKPTLYYLRAVARSRVDQSSLALTKEAIVDLDHAIAEGRGECDELLVELLERQRQLSSATGDDETQRAAVLRLTTLFPSIDRTQEAVDTLMTWVSDHPSDTEAARRLAELASRAGDWEAASDANLKLFEASKGDERVEAGLRYAEAQTERGSPLDARPVLEKLYAEAPNDDRVGSRLREAYESAGAHLELANMLLSRAAETNDKDLRYRLLVDAGELFVGTGEPHAEAVAALEEALKLRPEDHRAILGLAQATTLHGDIERACAVLGDAIKAHGKRRSPELAELQYGMALVAHVAGDDEGRFAWLDAALQSDRKNGVVASELALFAMEREDYDTALKALQLVTLLKDESPMSRAEAYLRQAQIALARSDNRKAALLAKRALTADSDYRPAKVFLEQMGL